MIGTSLPERSVIKCNFIVAPGTAAIGTKTVPKPGTQTPHSNRAHSMVQAVTRDSAYRSSACTRLVITPVSKIVAMAQDLDTVAQSRGQEAACVDFTSH